MSVRRLALSLVVVALALVGAATVTNTSNAQEPVTVPTTVGQTVTVTWQGTVSPGANASSECGQLTDLGADTHAIDIAVPAGAYDLAFVDTAITISYDGANDLIATVVFPDGTATSSDSGGFDTDETVAFADPAAGYLVWQTLVGAWPIGPDRLWPYVEKAVREAKRRTSWVDPDDAYAQNNLALSYYVQGQSQEAFKAFERAVRLAPSDAAIRRNAGIASAASSCNSMRQPT